MYKDVVNFLVLVPELQQLKRFLHKQWNIWVLLLIYCSDHGAQFDV